MLSREDFVAIAVRLFSVFLFLGVIKQVPGVVQFFATGDQGRAWAIFNALGLLSGLRADSGVVRHGASRAELVAEFSLADTPTALAKLAAGEAG